MGFTTGSPWNDYYQDYRERNIAAQEADPNSLLNHYRGLIRLREQARGATRRRLGSRWRGRPQSMLSLRSTDKEHVLVLVNLGSKPVNGYQLSLKCGHYSPAHGLPCCWATRLQHRPDGEPTGGFSGYRPIAELPPQSELCHPVCAVIT